MRTFKLKFCLFLLRAYLGLTAMALLCSFYVPAQDPPFMMPTAEKEGRLKPLPYGVDVRYQAIVQYYSDETGVPMWLACRMIGQESVGNPLAGVWDPKASNWLGAEGLTQLMRDNLVRFSVWYNDGYPIDPFDPETSIRVGLRYLADLYAETGSWLLALMCYNGGLGHWKDPGRWGPWKEESVDYVRVILRMGGG